MNPAKLSQLTKDDLISAWQKEQIAKGHQNPGFFMERKEFDPWKLDKIEVNAVKENIPSLNKLEFGGRYRCNKDINQAIKQSRFQQNIETFRNPK
jgi:predicted RND superfamily exporter protein